MKRWKSLAILCGVLLLSGCVEPAQNTSATSPQTSYTSASFATTTGNVTSSAPVTKLTTTVTSVTTVTTVNMMPSTTKLPTTVPTQTATKPVMNKVSTSFAYSVPESQDYAFWDGERVVCGTTTTYSKIQWMQFSLNYCICYEGLQADMLLVDGSFGPSSQAATMAFQNAYYAAFDQPMDADGSFGPATISAMLRVLDDGKDYSLGQPQILDQNLRLVWPAVSKTVTGKYGVNGSLRSNGTRYHSGLDIRASIGQPCYAAADGVVIMCKQEDDAPDKIGGRGRYIVVYHEQLDLSSIYEHLDTCHVAVGDVVIAGEQIGATGNSGWSSSGVHYAAHLHFGLMRGKMTDMGYDLWTVPGKLFNGVMYLNRTLDPDPAYNTNLIYQYVSD